MRSPLLGHLLGVFLWVYIVRIKGWIIHTPILTVLLVVLTSILTEFLTSHDLLRFLIRFLERKVLHLFPFASCSVWNICRTCWCFSIHPLFWIVSCGYFGLNLFVFIFVDGWRGFVLYRSTFIGNVFLLCRSSIIPDRLFVSFLHGRWTHFSRLFFP